jgi:hypothetical protein
MLKIRQIFAMINSFCMHWRPSFFMYALDELTLEDRCKKYWERYFLALSDTRDGPLIFELSNFNVLRGQREQDK